MFMLPTQEYKGLQPKTGLKQIRIKIQGCHTPAKIVFGCKPLSYLVRNTKNYDSHCF